MDSACPENLVLMTDAVVSRRRGRRAQRYGQSFQGHKFTQMFQSTLCSSAQYKFNLTHKLLPAKRTIHSASFRFRHVVIEPSLYDYTNNTAKAWSGQDGSGQTGRAMDSTHKGRTERRSKKDSAPEISNDWMKRKATMGARSHYEGLKSSHDANGNKWHERQQANSFRDDRHSQKRLANANKVTPYATLNATTCAPQLLIKNWLNWVVSRWIHSENNGWQCA